MMAGNAPSDREPRKVYIERLHGGQTHRRYVGQVDPTHPDELLIRNHSDGQHHPVSLRELAPEVYADHDLIQELADHHSLHPGRTRRPGVPLHLS
jgi:hypothetical protein